MSDRVSDSSKETEAEGFSATWSIGPCLMQERLVIQLDNSRLEHLIIAIQGVCEACWAVAKFVWKDKRILYRTMEFAFH